MVYRVYTRLLHAETMNTDGFLMVEGFRIYYRHEGEPTHGTVVGLNGGSVAQIIPSPLSELGNLLNVPTWVPLSFGESSRMAPVEIRRRQPFAKTSSTH